MEFSKEWLNVSERREELTFVRFPLGIPLIFTESVFRFEKHAGTLFRKFVKTRENSGAEE